jgi:4-hydroxyphenylpyruvate dioxygenase
MKEPNSAEITNYNKDNEICSTVTFLREHEAEIRKLGILIDIAGNPDAENAEADHFMLQTFTGPLMTRPTLFFEVISRHGSSGFGQKTIKALFEAVEKLQSERVL